MNFRTGGQTGVDRAVLDECLRRDIAVGGWCPDKRIAEDGRIADRYPLQALEEAGYPERTEANVRDSDATLVLHFGSITGGTKFTLECCQKLKKPQRKKIAIFHFNSLQKEIVQLVEIFLLMQED